MTAEEFDRSLLDLKYRKPFQPFVAELLDGRKVEFTRPTFVFGGGAGGFLDDDVGLVGVLHQDVRAFQLRTNES